MSDLLIKGLSEKVLNNLSKNADLNNLTLEEECKSILESHGRTNMEDTRKMESKILEKYRAEGRTFSDSGDDLSEDRMR